VGICETEDLEGFEQGGEGDVEVGRGGWIRLVVFAVGYLVALADGCVEVVGGEEGLVEKGGCCGASEACALCCIR
jgi:hypothetical protein